MTEVIIMFNVWKISHQRWVSADFSQKSIQFKQLQTTVCLALLYDGIRFSYSVFHFAFESVLTRADHIFFLCKTEC